MAGETTALVVFSPRSVFEELKGPAYSRLWRPGFLAALVEKHEPIWVVTPISHASTSVPQRELVMCNPDINFPLELDLFPMMAAIFDQQNHVLKAQAINEGLLKTEKDVWWINSLTRDLGIDEEYDQIGRAHV